MYAHTLSSMHLTPARTLAKCLLSRFLVLEPNDNDRPRMLQLSCSVLEYLSIVVLSHCGDDDQDQPENSDTMAQAQKRQTLQLPSQKCQYPQSHNTCLWMLPGTPNLVVSSFQKIRKCDLQFYLLLSNPTEELLSHILYHRYRDPLLASTVICLRLGYTPHR